MSDYPEHEKLKAIVGKSQAIGEFVEWLTDEKGIHLAEYPQVECESTSWSSVAGEPRWRCVEGRCLDFVDDDIGECENCEGTGMYQSETLWVVRTSIQSLLAEFFEIDQAQIDAEKEAMLEALRAETSPT